jgi:hypothetical protein
MSGLVPGLCGGGKFEALFGGAMRLAPLGAILEPAAQISEPDGQPQ